jgi:hypothetical protein
LKDVETPLMRICRPFGLALPNLCT